MRKSADLSYATILNSNLKDVTLDYSNLFNARLSGSFGYYLTPNGVPKESVLIWNEFVTSIDADFRHVDLSYSDLSYSDFSESRLDGANLQNTNIINANFNNVSLIGAYLHSTEQIPPSERKFI